MLTSSAINVVMNKTFPTNNMQVELLTVREYYAAAFVQAVLSNHELLKATLKSAPDSMKSTTAVAREGVRMADALIKELNQPN